MKEILIAEKKKLKIIFLFFLMYLFIYLKISDLRILQNILIKYFL